MASQTALSYCGQQVQTQDADRYLWCLSHPPAVREAMFAAVAFAGELARIPSLASEPMIGHIRFAWWREAIAEIYGGGKVRAHPIAEALKAAIDTYHLPRAPFDLLLDAREQDYAKERYASLDELADYACQCNMPLLELSLILQGKENAGQHAWAKQAAFVFGMGGIVRAMLHHPQLMDKTIPFLLQEEHKPQEPEHGSCGHSHREGKAIIALLAWMQEASPVGLPNESPTLTTRVMLLIGNHFLGRIRKGGLHVNTHKVETGRGWLVLRTLLCITFARR